MCVQLILLKSLRASTAVPSKHGTAWWHWCILHLPKSPAAFPWHYFLHPSAQGRRLVWERFACESAFFPGFTCLPVQIGHCPVCGCPTFPQHLHAGGSCQTAGAWKR